MDQRFMACASALYGNQVLHGQDWKAVYAVNIMECDFSTEFQRFPPADFQRHYQMTDLSIQGTPRPLDHLHLIQVSLRAVDLDQVADAEARCWLDFFKNGHGYRAVPAGCPPPIAAAYARIRADALPPAVRSALDAEDRRRAGFQELLEWRTHRAEQESRAALLGELLRDGAIGRAAHDAALHAAAGSDAAPAEAGLPQPPPAAAAAARRRGGRGPGGRKGPRAARPAAPLGAGRTRRIR